MTNQPNTASDSQSVVYALIGTVLLAIGGMLFVNLDEDPQTFIVLTVAFSAPGLYLLIAGAVARGVGMTRG
jgi:LPXTG-motif cell wall-anchored protein